MGSHVRHGASSQRSMPPAGDREKFSGTSSCDRLLEIEMRVCNWSVCDLRHRGCAQKIIFMACNFRSFGKIAPRALRRESESTMTRISNTVTVWSRAALLPVGVVMSLVVSTAAWPETMPDFSAFQAGPVRKAVFFDYVEPLIAEANETVAADRVPWS